MLGLARTEASAASLLLNVESLATMAIAWLVFRENVDRRLLLGAAAILAGACILAWSGSQVNLSAGALFVVGACIAWGVDNNLTRKLSGSDPTQIAMLKGLVAGAANVTLAIVAGSELPPSLAILSGAILGLVSIGISLVLFMLALRHLGTARTGAYYAVAPFLGALLSVVFLDEPLSVRLVAAGLLMALGVWLHLTESHEHEHEHESLAHEHAHVHDRHHQHAHDGPVTEPHSHWHVHAPLRHKHQHFPDLHHRHTHG
jgi:drug/metabolite transporter (DMT)-like permease